MKQFEYVMICLLLSGCSPAALQVVTEDTSPLNEWLLETDNATPEITDAPENNPDLYDNLLLANPLRTDPFAAATAAPILTSDAVELKGFIEVDEPRAILLVDNVITVISEEQLIRGIKVLEIRPPEILYEHNGVQHSLSLLSM